jgi:hypothetical protein
MSKIDLKELERISKEKNVSFNKVFDVVDSQFRFLNKVIKERNTDSFRMKYFGLFRVKPRVEDKLKKMIEKDDIIELGKKE